MRARRRVNTGETGAAAVEFALVLPLLFVLLFGIIEFGFGLFQLQAAQASVREAARGVALGVESCAEVEDLVERAVQNNGLGIAPTGIAVSLRITPSPEAAVTPPNPERGDSAVLTLTYEPTLDFPLIPFPSEITRRSGTTLEDVGETMQRDCGELP
jgi:Flp pilus assembly protein TadG